MNFDETLFAVAHGYATLAKDVFKLDLTGNISSTPLDYPYTETVSSIISEINSLKTNVETLDTDIGKRKDKIMGTGSESAAALQSAYEMYYSNFLLMSSSFLSQNGCDESSYILESQENAYNYLKAACGGDPSLLPEELQITYKGLDEYFTYVSDCEELDKLKANPVKLEYNGSGSNAIPKNTKEYYAYWDKVHALEASKTAYETAGMPEEKKWYEDWADAGTAMINSWSTAFKSGNLSDYGKAIKQTGATAIVVGRSVTNGVYKVGEYITDGVVGAVGYTVGGVTWLFDHEKGSKVFDKTLDAMRVDVVGELNKSFYEDTNIGTWINENSALKYDSAGAKAFQTGAEFVGKVAVAAVATYFGGPLGALAAGALFGAGSKGEKYAQTVNREFGEDYNHGEALLRMGAGAAVGAAEFYGYGQMATNMLGLTNAANPATSFTKNFITTETITDTVAVVSDHGVNVLLGDETWQEALKFGGLELLLATGMNAYGARQATKAATAMNNADEVIDGVRRVSDLDSTTTRFADEFDVNKVQPKVIISDEEKIVKLLDDKGYTIESYSKKLGDVSNFADNISPECKESLTKVSVKVRKTAELAEPSITKTLHSLETDGAYLIGLDHRFKSVESIERKIYNGATLGMSSNYLNEQIFDNVANNLNDSLRYTLILDEGSYTDDVFKKIFQLKQQGYEVVDVNNAWYNFVNSNKSGYQGLNFTLKSPDGLDFELQFHTKDSFNVKENMNHIYYEISRNPNADKDIVDLSNSIMRENQINHVVVPDKISSVSSTELLDQIDKYTLHDYKFSNTHNYSLIPPSNANFFDLQTADVKEMAEIYGDAGRLVRDKLSEGKSITDIISEMSEDEAIQFRNFLDNTIEGRYLKSLTIDELSDMNCYTGGSFSIINSALRSKDMSGLMNGKPMQEFIDSLDQAIYKYGGLHEDTRLFRGIDIYSFTNQSEDFATLFSGTPFDDNTRICDLINSVQGKTFFDLGYMSTSPSYSASFATYPSKNIVLDIDAPKGTNGAYINQISNFYNQENEVLLGRGTRLKLESAEVKVIGGQEKVIVKCSIEQ